MGQRPIENYTLSDSAAAALAAGDVNLLLSLHKSIFGGWCMEDETDEGDGEDISDDAEEDEDESDEGAKPKGKGNSKIKELSDENARRRNENKQLAKERDALAAKVKAAEDANLGETEKTVKERDELKTSVESLAAKNRELALRVEFLQDKAHDWHNPKAALRLLELDGVEIDDDGEVTGLDKAIEKLAKENPYLLRVKDADEEETSGPPASGQPVGKIKKSAATAALEKKYRLGV